MNKRIQNISIALISILFFVWRGSARKKSSLRKVIIVQPTGNIGDMVCITPLIVSLKRSIPNIYIAVIGSEKNKNLFEVGTDIDEYLDFAMPVFSLIKYLRAKKFDAGIVVNFDVSHLCILFLGMVTSITCFELSKKYIQYEPLPYRILSKLMYRTEYFFGEYVPAQYLKLLTHFNIPTGKPEKRLFVSKNDHSAVNEMLKSYCIANNKIVVIAPGAGADYKRWPAERFAILANYISRHGYTVVITGGLADKQVIQEMISALPSPTTHWVSGPLPMGHLKALTSIARFVVGNDSGVIHVAEAVGSATLTIAGATDVGEHMQEDDMHKIIKSNVTGAIYQAYIIDESKIDRDLARKQMDAVTVEKVMAVIDKFIS